MRSGRGMPWAKEYHDKSLSRTFDARLSVEAVGVLYLCRMLAGQAWAEGRILVDGQFATRPALLAWLKRQFQEAQVTAALGELFERGLLKTEGRWNHVVVVPWRDDQAETPEAKRKREQRERETNGSGKQGDELLTGRENALYRNRSINTGKNERDCHGTVTAEEKRPRKEERIFPEPEERAGADNVVRFPVDEDSEFGGGRFAPAGTRPFSVLGSGDSEDRRRERREEERRGEQTRQNSGTSDSGGRVPAGANERQDWRTLDVYRDPFLAAMLVTGEGNPESAATWRNALRDLGPERLGAAVAEVRQERLAGKAPKPGRLLAHILNRYRAAAKVPTQTAMRKAGVQ